METIKQPAVAGMFYPADPDQLRRELVGYLAGAAPTLASPKALIAPHAGYIYSGPVAGSAYAQLHQSAKKLSRVVILAPAHRVAFHGIALCGAERFRTPLGDIEVDQGALAAIADLPQVDRVDRAFAQEHSIEVHLPFLQTVLERFTLVPLLVGNATPEAVSEVIERLWGGDETLLVVSSDLSHYLDYDSAQRMDRAATSAIEALEPDRLQQGHACGHIAVAGLLLAARRHQLHAVTLDLRNSGDTAGGRDQVVGYGAYGFA